MPKGGARHGAGRIAGGQNKRTKEVLSLLKDNTEIIIDKAIALATQKEPNVAVLLKLIDKVLPTLTSSKVDADINNKSIVATMSAVELKNLIVSLSQVADTDIIEDEKV